MDYLIDPHVHLRDWNQSHKETLAHGMGVAWRCGISALFEMPNTDPTLTDSGAVERRIAAADTARASLDVEGADAIFHGLYIGLTGDAAQVREAVELHGRYFPRVVGMKLYAGHSTGRMGVTVVEEQLVVWRTLAAAGYRGVVAIHAEREDLLRPDLWDPRRPETHSDARPPLAEIASVQTQLALAESAGFRGTLHICHISTPEAVELLRGEASSLPFRVVCAATPHHLLLSRETAATGGPFAVGAAAAAAPAESAATPPHRGDQAAPTAWLNVNPPLRDTRRREALFQLLEEGAIDWIESDHAPHASNEKAAGASGLPGFLGLRLLADRLRGRAPHARRLCSEAVLETFGMPAELIPSNPNLERPLDRDAIGAEYPWDPYVGVN